MPSGGPTSGEIAADSMRGAASGDEVPRRLAVGERLKHHVVAAWANGARFHEPWNAMKAPPR
jgi:hypothetical protein